MTRLANLSNSFAKWQSWPILAIMLVGLAATVCLAYMAGYYDGYHAGAIHYIDLASLPNGTTYLAPGKYAVGGQP
jgi:hypothetical protein